MSKRTNILWFVIKALNFFNIQIRHSIKDTMLAIPPNINQPVKHLFIMEVSSTNSEKLKIVSIPCSFEWVHFFTCFHSNHNLLTDRPIIISGHLMLPPPTPADLIGDIGAAMAIQYNDAGELITNIFKWVAFCIALNSYQQNLLFLWLSLFQVKMEWRLGSQGNGTKHLLFPPPSTMLALCLPQLLPNLLPHLLPHLAAAADCPILTVPGLPMLQQQKAIAHSHHSQPSRRICQPTTLPRRTSDSFQKNSMAWQNSWISWRHSYKGYVYVQFMELFI